MAGLAEKIEGGYTVGRLAGIAHDTGTALVAGLPEIDGDRLYNSAVLITPEGDVSLYRKTHLFDREKLFFDPGNSGFSVFTWREIRIGIMICFDWYFPESARTLALGGAQIIAHPSNLVLPHCPTAMVTRCLENRIFTITANRSGSEHRGGLQLDYIGNSRIIGPNGHILGKAEAQRTAVVTVTIDPTMANNKAVTPRNNLFVDRRINLYHRTLDF